MSHPWVCSRVLAEGGQGHSTPEPEGTLEGKWGACDPLLFSPEKPSPHQMFTLLEAAGMGR